MSFANQCYIKLPSFLLTEIATNFLQEIDASQNGRDQLLTQ